MAYLTRPHAQKAMSTYIGGVQLGTKVQDSGPCHVSTESSDYYELIMKSHTRISMLIHSHSSYVHQAFTRLSQQSGGTYNACCILILILSYMYLNWKWDFVVFAL